MQHSQEAHFRSHLSRLNEHSDKCKGLSRKLEQVNDQVLQMRDAWQGVEDGGRSLQEASEQLLKEKVKVVLTLLA
jgi:conserved oligomeric Golgi complex subunit 3